MVSASLRPSHPLAAGALFDRSHIWGVGLMNCDAVHRSHPLAAGALPKFESGSATYFLLYIVARKQAFATIYNKKSLAIARLSNFGWKMGFEPTTFGTTIRHSNRLSYIHHIIRFRIGDKSNTLFSYIQIFLDSFLKKVIKSILFDWKKCNHLKK